MEGFSAEPSAPSKFDPDRQMCTDVYRGGSRKTETTDDGPVLSNVFVPGL